MGQREEFATESAKSDRLLANPPPVFVNAIARRQTKYLANEIFLPATCTFSRRIYEWGENERRFTQNRRAPGRRDDEALTSQTMSSSLSKGRFQRDAPHCRRLETAAPWPAAYHDFLEIMGVARNLIRRLPTKPPLAFWHVGAEL